MDKEICTIFIGAGGLDDDYTFYESGKIKRFYDRNTFKLNITEWVEAKDISDGKRKKLVEKCEPEHKAKIMEILR